MERSPFNVGAGSGMPPPRAASQCMPAQKKSPQEIQAIVATNLTRQQELHMAKTAKSDANFKNTRVTTGERIFVKNGKAVAIGFKSPNIRPTDTAKGKGGETTSMA